MTLRGGRNRCPCSDLREEEAETWREVAERGRDAGVRLLDVVPPLAGSVQSTKCCCFLGPEQGTKPLLSYQARIEGACPRPPDAHRPPSELIRRISPSHGNCRSDSVKSGSSFLEPALSCLQEADFSPHHPKSMEWTPKARFLSLVSQQTYEI